ncbi:hypothetical protein RHECNPAF_520017 [Rhizobium etli CNPAF512]|nr:hypothetical protein RHECNPAF_520017 [Rhizobium etli CNPAF512]
MREVISARLNSRNSKITGSTYPIFALRVFKSIGLVAKFTSVMSFKATPM